jgi:glucose dehydrogenase
MSPHDEFDYDGVNESVLIDLAPPSGTRKVLVHLDSNGYVYVIDRVSGEVVSATPFVSVTTSTGVDLATGSLLQATSLVLEVTLDPDYRARLLSSARVA